MISDRLLPDARSEDWLSVRTLDSAGSFTSGEPHDHSPHLGTRHLELDVLSPDSMDYARHDMGAFFFL